MTRRPGTLTAYTWPSRRKTSASSPSWSRTSRQPVAGRGRQVSQHGLDGVGEEGTLGHEPPPLPGIGHAHAGHDGSDPRPPAQRAGVAVGPQFASAGPAGVLSAASAPVRGTPSAPAAPRRFPRLGSGAAPDVTRCPGGALACPHAHHGRPHRRRDRQVRRPAPAGHARRARRHRQGLRGGRRRPGPRPHPRRRRPPDPRPRPAAGHRPGAARVDLPGRPAQHRRRGHRPVRRPAAGPRGRARLLLADLRHHQLRRRRVPATRGRSWPSSTSAPRPPRSSPSSSSSTWATSPR